MTQLRYSEDAVDKATSSFSSLNTPTGSDHLAKRVNRLLSKAGDLVGQARLAVHRGNEGGYDELVDSLRSLADSMESAEASIR